MYCRICGTEQTESTNYCSHDGAMTNSFSKEVVLQKEDSTYCRACGEQNTASASYCGKCGESILKIGVVSKDIGSIEQQKIRVSKVKMSTLQRGLFGGMIASLVMLLTGWIGSLVLGGMSETALKNMFQFTEVPFEISQIFDAFSSISNTILNFHLLGISVEGIGENLATIKLDIPFFFFICIPFLILSGVGCWMQKKYQMSSMFEKWITAFVTGLTYGVFLMIVSFTADYEILMMKIGYSFVASLVVGIIYGTLFSFVGMLLYAGRFNRDTYMNQLMPFGAAVYQGITVAVKGLAVSVVCIAGLFIALDRLNFSSNNTISEEVITAMQVAPKAWGMAHFAPVRIESDPLAETMHAGFSEMFNRNIDPDDMYVQFSYISGVSVAGMSPKELLMAEKATLQEIKEVEEQNSIFHWGLLLTIIPVFFMFLAGRKLAHYHSQNMYRTLAVLSGTYALVALLINRLSSITISGKIEGMLADFASVNGTLISVQNHTIYLLFFSFILAYAASFVGMKMAKK